MRRLRNNAIKGPGRVPLRLSMKEAFFRAAAGLATDAIPVPNLALLPVVGAMNSSGQRQKFICARPPVFRSKM